ncbi:MAG TPA: glycine zipper 2TM domain-containing protein [Chitinophagaceae bacterium]|jgi:hypothetical protein|nr:glycine zipper 2TM domain-containing protein [Chitinophagaceae bacterium]
MKKVLSIITMTAAIAVLVASCKSPVATAPATNQDTTGFAEFKEWQAWKSQTTAPAPVPVQQVVVVKKTKSTSGSMNSSTTNEAQTVKKKGWSKAAKGAVIGGVTGGVLGAVINKKNRVAGGVIGGILGGGLGYGIGRSKDKKDGRVQ